jgi:mannitol/fructose-specific phosphotransferase system IIA component (Ntr-type)
MAIGRPATPIDFQAIDGRPVTIIWLLTSPPDKTAPHIHALARISRLMTMEKFRQALNQAKTNQEMFDIIAQQENLLAQGS